MASNFGSSYCEYCGAEFRLFSISNRDMQGLCKVWKNRHEIGCKKRTPKQRRTCAKPYIGKTQLDSSLTLDINHVGFKDQSDN